MAKEPIGSARIDTNEAAAAKEPDTPQADRDEIASQMVDRYALWSGAAGLIPLPLVDVATVGGVQIQMLRKLAELYGVSFSEDLGKAVLASLVGSMIPATSSLGIASVLKVVPLIGTPIAWMTMPALSAGATYAIGKVFIRHFATGGTLLDFNPPDYREFLKAQREKWSRRSAISTRAPTSQDSPTTTPH
ncbi:MAG TPA: YcjF family protein [Xanthobacteraceae bacterium]|jgi:uncharacterized protein (DUF697 family)